MDLGSKFWPRMTNLWVISTRVWYSWVCPKAIELCKSPVHRKSLKLAFQFYNTGRLFERLNKPSNQNPWHYLIPVPKIPKNLISQYSQEYSRTLISTRSKLIMSCKYQIKESPVGNNFMTRKILNFGLVSEIRLRN